jgi:hypothetical protein
LWTSLEQINSKPQWCPAIVTGVSHVRQPVSSLEDDPRAAHRWHPVVDGLISDEREATTPRDVGEGEGGTAEGYGSVPFSRTEWSAKRIIASFAVDIELLRSYGLPNAATETLETLALWEVRNLLDRGLRLRTACDLELVSPVTARRGPDLPPANELTDTLHDLIAKSNGAFGDGEAITVEWSKKG